MRKEQALGAPVVCRRACVCARRARGGGALRRMRACLQRGLRVESGERGTTCPTMPVVVGSWVSRVLRKPWPSWQAVNPLGPKGSTHHMPWPTCGVTCEPTELPPDISVCLGRAGRITQRFHRAASVEQPREQSGECVRESPTRVCSSFQREDSPFSQTLTNTNTNTAMAAACVVCQVPASVYCSNDKAHLCDACDVKIHSSNNAVAGRHHRVRICANCVQAPSIVYCHNDGVHLCTACDAEIHSNNPLAASHDVVPSTPLPCPEVRRHSSVTDRHTDTDTRKPLGYAPGGAAPKICAINLLHTCMLRPTYIGIPIYIYAYVGTVCTALCMQPSF